MSVKVKIVRTINDYFSRIAMNDAIIQEAAILNKETFGPFKNLCMGNKPVVVCGAGPTLQKYQPIKDAIHIAVNRAFLYEMVNFDFIFVQDFDGIRMIQNEIVEYSPDTCTKLLGFQCGNSKEIPESLALKCNAKRFITDIGIVNDGFKSKPVVNIDARPIGNMPNVGISVMQFALFMNPSEIYIVGCDMAGGHFSQKNVADKAQEDKSNEALFLREHNRLIQKWGQIKDFASLYYPDTKLISVNPIGLKGMFEDLVQ